MMLIKCADLQKDIQQLFYVRIRLICINNVYGCKGCTLYTIENNFLVPPAVPIKLN